MNHHTDHQRNQKQKEKRTLSERNTYKDSKDTARKKQNDSNKDGEFSLGTGNMLKGRRILKALRKSAEKPKDFDYTKERVIDNNN